MSWEKSLKILNEEGIGGELAYLHSRTSSVTTSWGVDWNETYIARDIMQNFFDANRNRVTEIQVGCEGTTVMISAPAAFVLTRLFYLGSEKGGDDIGQYGEGFKAAAVCLLRDHGIEPIVVSGDQIVYLRVESEKVAGTQLQPVVYDFFRASNACVGTRMILRGCTKNLIQALRDGLTHFFFDQNPLLGTKIWSSWDGLFAAYSARTTVGHVFYCNFKRGEIPEIPVVFVINKNFERIEKKIRSDRDRNAFGGKLMDIFYQIFVKSGLKMDQAGERAIVAIARNSWVRGHPLLKAISEARRFRQGWPPAATKELFGDRFFARSTSQNAAESLEYQNLERLWQDSGRQDLPAYFSDFGVLNARDYCVELKRKAHEEAKSRHNRTPSNAEQGLLNILGVAIRELAPGIMKIFDQRSTHYSVAETEIILGELKAKRSYQAREVFLSSQVFVADFAEALAVFLHEHAHIFGYDGSRGFTDGLTELLETVVRERKSLDQYEAKWDAARERVVRERGEAANQPAPVALEQVLGSMNEAQLRDFITRLPKATVKRALKSNEE